VNAARSDDLAEFKRIAAKGVSLDGQEKGMLGQTPLVAASAFGNGTNVFYYLLSARAKLDAGDHEGKTPLMYAVMFGDVNISKIEALIAAGADVNARNKFGSSVLTYAKWASTGHVATNTLELLQQNGAKE
jgi:ankyrin repeat protein